MFTSDVDVSLGAYAGKFQPGRNAVGTDVQLSALATAQHAVLADTNELRKARDLDDLGKQRQALIGLPNESIVPPRNDDLPSDTMDITLAHVNKMMSAKTVPPQLNQFPCLSASASTTTSQARHRHGPRHREEHGRDMAGTCVRTGQRYTSSEAGGTRLGLVSRKHRQGRPPPSSHLLQHPSSAACSSWRKSRKKMPRSSSLGCPILPARSGLTPPLTSRQMALTVAPCLVLSINLIHSGT